MSNNENSPNIAGMLIFSRVVEAGSFSEAARKLGSSKASVSRAVAALEKRLGAQLLRRTTRRMSLTDVGEVFHERCRRVIEEAEAAELSVSQLQASPKGTIRIAAPMSFGHGQLAHRLGGFLAQYPMLHVDLDLTDRRIDLIREKFDMAVRIGRPTERSYVVRKLAVVRALVCASPGYLERHGVPEHPTDLLGHNCLGYSAPPETWNFTGGVQVRTRGTLNADNGDALRRAALANHGLVYLPTFLVGDDLRAGRLVPVLVDFVDREIDLCAVYPESRHLSPKVRAMIDWMVGEFGPSPDWDEELPRGGGA